MQRAYGIQLSNVAGSPTLSVPTQAVKGWPRPDPKVKHLERKTREEGFVKMVPFPLHVYLWTVAVVALVGNALTVRGDHGETTVILKGSHAKHRPAILEALGGAPETATALDRTLKEIEGASEEALARIRTAAEAATADTVRNVINNAVSAALEQIDQATRDARAALSAGKV